MGSTSSIVISFSIAILLLLVLLLLLSYNSKCKADKVERFTSDDYIPFDLGNGERFTANLLEDNQYMDFRKPPKPEGFNSVANNDIYALKTDNLNINTKENQKMNVSSYEVETANSSLTGSEGFENPLVPAQDPTTCFKRDRLTKDDLLPKDANLKWATINPSSSGDITDKNFLTAGYHIGVNTVGQSLRNANLQLRSEIPNPQVAVSPWMISTIEPDVRPVSFEIGSAPSY